MRNISWCPCLKVRVNFHPLINYAAYFTVRAPVLQSRLRTPRVSLFFMKCSKLYKNFNVF